MAFQLDDLLQGTRKSRAHFLKHITGLTPEQWDWQPYAECKSVRETIQHLIVVDRSVALMGQEWTFDTWNNLGEAVTKETSGLSTEQLLNALAESHTAKLNFLETQYANQPLDTQVPFWGETEKLGTAVAHISSEDYYHSGQVAFIRQATDPTWDYYATIYA